MLDQMITIVATTTIMAYSLYTVEGTTGNHRLIVTIPLVLYGIFRYLYLVYMRMEGGSPEEVLLRDRHMLGTVMLCTILILLSCIYCLNKWSRYLFTRNIRTGIVFSLLLAFVVMTAIALYSDVPKMLAALVHFRWIYLPLILGFTLFNYFWRFVKWQYYLRRLKIVLDWRKSLIIFLSGLSMAITPGKVGELLKSYLLRQATGAAISRTSPIIVAERLTDGIAMLGLAATGLVLYRFGWQILLILFVFGIFGIAVVQNRTVVLQVLQRLNECQSWHVSQLLFVLFMRVPIHCCSGVRFC